MLLGDYVFESLVKVGAEREGLLHLAEIRDTRLLVRRGSVEKQEPKRNSRPLRQAFRLRDGKFAVDNCSSITVSLCDVFSEGL
ncbi:hypothetical protein WJ00_10675 [Burkholderia vietnamiensis]|nr:hypothetical protein WJ00_10675 [Burkholderia vietnamiensis]